MTGTIECIRQRFRDLYIIPYSGNLRRGF